MSEAANAHYFKTADGLNLHYRDFGGQNEGTPIVCLPGLTRNGRDFDDLARRLSDRRRVLTLDFRGRGQSDYDPDKGNYRPEVYVADVWALLDSLAVGKVIVVGSSLGGYCAMLMAAQQGERVAGIVLNDIGPEVNAAGLERLREYVGLLPPVSNWDEAVAQVREIHGPWLPGLSDEGFEALARRGFREDEKGVPVADFDPGVARAVREGGPDGDAWPMFHALPDISMLLLRGAMSDILTEDIVDRMLAAKPNLEVVRVADRGHVPLLDEPECVAAIDGFVGSVP